MLTLRDLYRNGYRSLRICCLAAHCRRWLSVDVERLLARSAGNGDIDLWEVARRARCSACGQRGAHIEPFQIGRMPRG